MRKNLRHDGTILSQATVPGELTIRGFTSGKITDNYADFVGPRQADATAIVRIRLVMWDATLTCAPLLQNVKKYQDRVTGDESDFDVVTKPLRFCGGERSHEPISKGTTVTTAGARDAVRITIPHKFIDRV